jgi:hypothetical protein
LKQNKEHPLPQFDGLDRRARRWLDYEQTVNERLFNDKMLVPFDDRSNTVKTRFYPERRPVWEQDLVWLPNNMVRRYGLIDESIRTDFGIRPRRNFTPLFLHPQTPAPHRELAEQYGRERLADFAVTPTASYRSVVLWDRTAQRSPGLLKLSIGAIIAHTRRVLRENQVARAVLISSLFDCISRKDRQRFDFDWFSEPAGMVETRSRHGWLLRRWPDLLNKAGSTTLMPTFSLISRDGSDVPLLISLLGTSRKTPEAFVIDRLLRPYVAALAHLLFEEGLQYEGHPQNVLWELDSRDHLTGRMVLRDLADTSVNIALRIAKGKPLPKFPRRFLPDNAPFPIAGNAADYRTNAKRWRILRGFDTVEAYGLRSFVWAINKTMLKFCPRYDAKLVEQRYLELWQEAAISSLRARPLFRRNPKGLAIDEAVAYFLSQTDWKALGGRPSRLPASAEPLFIEGRMHRRRGAVYLRVASNWGDLFICEGRPGFFRPAF